MRIKAPASPKASPWHNRRKRDEPDHMWANRDHSGAFEDLRAGHRLEAAAEPPSDGFATPGNCLGRMIAAPFSEVVEVSL